MIACVCRHKGCAYLVGSSGGLELGGGERMHQISKQNLPTRH